MPPARVVNKAQYNRFPIAKQIAAVSAAWRSRHSILNPELCDNVIRRLAPSLAQHVGCHIIDINPGIGLWSSKLHDFLKPKSHVLMEPQQNVFLPYLEPLLKTPDSRYTIRNWWEEDQWQPQKYIEEGLIPSLEEYGGKKQSPILIIVNLASRDSQIRTAPGAQAHIKAIDLKQAVRMKSGFEAYGPTRVLIWMPDADKRALVPRTVGYRGQLAVSLESTHRIEEIAGAVPVLTRARREDALDVQSSEMVAKRMNENHVWMPPNQPLQNTHLDSETFTTRSWHKEFRELEEGFLSLRLSQFVGKPPGPIISSKKGYEFTPEYKRYRSMRTIFEMQDKMTKNLKPILQEQAEIDELDLMAHQETDLEKKQQIWTAMDSKIKDLKSTTDTLTSKVKERWQHIEDDRKAFYQNPPQLMWDRRQAEPLIVDRDDFYPQKELALLDFQPQPPDKQWPMTTEQAIYFDVMCTHLLAPRGGTTLKHLNHIAPGAYEALVPHAPAVTDPSKGGRRDIESLRTRNLTPEMLWQLALAWDKWLFKPDFRDLMQNFGPSTQRTINLRRNNE